MISHHAALIYTMVLTAAADRDLSDAESRRIRAVITNLPVFADYPMAILPETANACIDVLQAEDGLDQALEMIRRSIPKKLRETAYALACDVAAADGRAGQTTLRLLEMIRDRLDIDRLIAAGIERGARARFTRYQHENHLLEETK